MKRKADSELAENEQRAFMRCIVLQEIGSKDLTRSLSLVERDCPKASDHEVILQVLAVGINPSDVKATTGAFPYAVTGAICGRDCCGRIVEGPPSEVGKLVWSTSGKERGLAGDGGLAEFTKIPLAACLPLPKGITPAQAGALGVPLCTAACAVTKLQLRKGETVAVTGANGQVARFVMQIAKWRGANTIGVVRRDVPLSSADHKVVATVDEHVVKKLKTVGDVHAVVDTVGVGTEHLVESLAHGGRIVIMSCPGADTSFPLAIRSFYRKDLTLHSTETMQHGAVKSAELVRDLLPGFECGALTPPELHEQIFTLDAVRDAYKLVGDGCQQRVVVAPNGLNDLEQTLA
eukprot:TRINITY_DN42737_c0_g1_i1.p1 TRINITY_DN42737_c0_g1~~TRINITY_DN42737_c0_g1_i1.p1  ORF type:complete len:348 (-),score=39.61 TRINITY_DN42737_c0_g1_i1:30-1073(-)